MLLDLNTRLKPTYTHVGCFVFGRRERIHERFEMFGRDALTSFYEERGFTANPVRNLESGGVQVAVYLTGTRYEAAQTCRSLVPGSRTAAAQVGLKYLYWEMLWSLLPEPGEGVDADVIPIRPHLEKDLGS